MSEWDSELSRSAGGESDWRWPGCSASLSSKSAATGPAWVLPGRATRKPRRPRGVRRRGRRRLGRAVRKDDKLEMNLKVNSEGRVKLKSSIKFKFQV